MGIKIRDTQLPLREKVLLYLKSRPVDEVYTSSQVAEAIDCNSLRLAEVVTRIPEFKGWWKKTNKLYWGKPEAIVAFTKHLEKQAKELSLHENP
jgi:hypothetical protein